MTVVFTALVACAATACTGARAADTTGAAAAQVSTPRTAKIVFVGKERPCDCTRKSIDAAWAVLQMVLGTPSKVPVEQLKIDTEPTKVEPYRKQRAIMALPAVYFVDGGGKVIEMLQGTITAAQVSSLVM